MNLAKKKEVKFNLQTINEMVFDKLLEMMEKKEWQKKHEE